MTTTADVKRYREFLADEADGVFMYAALADLEEDEDLREIYRKLSESEVRHLDLWREQLRAAGEDDTPPPPSRRIRLIMWLARRFGTETVLPIIKTMETDATSMYTGIDVAEAAGLPSDETAHYRVFDALTKRQRNEGVSGSVIGRVESRHRALGGGNALRAAVLGANDGLVSNLALVAGFAGADPGQGAIVLAGVAGLVAGAFSMALGEWISVTSSREAAEAQLRVEREELAMAPDEEAEELALIYQARGLPREAAEQLARQIVAEPEHALSTLAREELGIVPEELGSPWAAALASFFLFAIGAIIPVFPFFFGSGLAFVVVGAAASGVGLFLLGAAITLLTGRNWLFGGGRQLVLGLAAAVVTYVIGGLVGGVAGV
ncbi:MAG: VIT1/CCC1 transporter family protein [Dehalococcoidia bacterium]|nr:VIT1/CCC1 transporter family protein [Dehalococcoidia bacterium]